MAIPHSIENRLQEEEQVLWCEKSTQPLLSPEKLKFVLTIILAVITLLSLLGAFPGGLPLYFRILAWGMTLALLIGTLVVCFVLPLFRPAMWYAVTNQRVLGEHRTLGIFKKRWEYPIAADMMKGATLNSDGSGDIDFGYDLSVKINNQHPAIGFRGVAHVRRVEELLVQLGANPIPLVAHAGADRRKAVGMLVNAVVFFAVPFAMLMILNFLLGGREDWIFADATITEVTPYSEWRNNRNYSGAELTVRFRTAEGTEVETRTERSGSTTSVSVGGVRAGVSQTHAKVGQKIRILYDPQNPDYISTEETTEFLAAFRKLIYFAWCFAALEIIFALHAFTRAARTRELLRSRMIE